MKPLSTLRLTLLRGCYLMLAVGLATRHWPTLFGDVATLPLMNGVVVSILTALGLLAVIGLFSPVKMLPLLLFEVAWKAIWVVAVALPNWQQGTLDAGMEATLLTFAWVTPLLVVIPWRYAAQMYLTSVEPLRAPSAIALQGGDK